MQWLVLKSWFLIAYLDCVMHFDNFKRLHHMVRTQEMNARTSSEDGVHRVCRAVDLACALYFKRVLCLQRSAATTIMLRRNGAKAELVIGAQLIPFRSHAWVEIDGQVVNDKPYLSQIFQLLDRL